MVEIRWSLRWLGQALTIKLKELGVERGSDGFVVRIMLKNDMSNQTHRNKEWNIHMPPSMGEPVPPRQLPVSLDQMSTR